MNNLDHIFKIGTLLLLTGILLAIAYFGFNGQNYVDKDAHYVKYAGLDAGGLAILDEENGIVYFYGIGDKKEEFFRSIDLVNGKSL